MGELHYLQQEDCLSVWYDTSKHSSYNEAFEEGVRQFDNGENDGFAILSVNDGVKVWHRFYGYMLHKEQCPVCGCGVRHMDLVPTYDCHGIRYRMVCEKCRTRIMDEIGFDGEYYDELDECIDEDW